MPLRLARLKNEKEEAELMEKIMQSKFAEIQE